MPKVSVIVPVYNVEKYIEKCLDSLINQTLEDIEFIVVNDGSTDNSKELIMKYAEKCNKIKYYEKEKWRTFRCKKLWNEICNWRLYSIFGFR